MTTSRLTVAVLTFRRPEHIVELAPILVQQADQARSAIDGLESTTVLVVDNDPDASARSAISAIPGVRYVHEPTPGISAGRNRALDESRDADLLVFIDDDERPEPDWLTTLLDTRARLGVDAVVGRVKREFDGPVDAWLLDGGFFPSPDIVTGTPVKAAATNNLLLDLAKVREFGLRFDDQFGLTGGGDTHFTRAFVARGGSLVWCNEAVVVDQVPVSRTNRRWGLQRAYRGGNSDARVSLALAGSAGARTAVRLRSFVRGVARLVGGLGRVAVGKIARRRAVEASGARTAARGLGMVAAAWGRHFAEYGRAEA